MYLVWIVAAVFAITSWALVSDSSASQQPARSVWDGVYSDAQAKRGEAVYRSACASCHLADLTGGAAGSPLTGRMFLRKWHRQTVGDLVDLTRVSMPVQAPGTLTPQQYTDVIAFVLQGNQMPSGGADLPLDGQALRSIRILHTKPTP